MPRNFGLRQYEPELVKAPAPLSPGWTWLKAFGLVVLALICGTLTVWAFL